MKTKPIFSSPYFFLFLLAVLFLLLDSTFAQTVTDTTAAAAKHSRGGASIFDIVIVTGYLLGVFILLPWVVYTNMKEGLSLFEPQNMAAGASATQLSEDERNSISARILEEIEGKLTPMQDEGEAKITITKGSQARFTRRGIDYITKNLVPTDPQIIERVNEIVALYNDRTKRVFTGSKWIIGCSVGLGLFFLYMMGIKTFIFIHALGIVFYILSSRTPIYLLEKRMNLFGRFGGTFVASIFTGLFVGAGTKYYKVYSDGHRERDYDSELTSGFAVLMIMLVIAMILGFLAAALGVVNFLMNYMNNAMLPVKPESWYQKNIAAPVPA
jgi:hypothetical protein